MATNKFFYTSLVLAALVFVQTDAYLGNIKATYEWTQTLATGASVEGSAIVGLDRNVVEVNYTKYESDGYFFASTLYDFTNGDDAGIALTYVNGPGGCYVFNITGLTFAGVVAEAAARNGATVSAFDRTDYDGTGDLLDFWTNYQALYAEFPDFSNIRCSSIRISYPFQEGATYDKATSVIKFLWFDKEVYMTMYY